LPYAHERREGEGKSGGNHLLVGTGLWPYFYEAFFLLREIKERGVRGSTPDVSISVKRKVTG